MQSAQGEPGCIVLSGAPGFGRGPIQVCASAGAGTSICYFTQECSIVIEYLNAAIAAIGDIDVALRIRSDAVGRIEFAWTAAWFAPLLHPVAVLVVLRHA